MNSFEEAVQGELNWRIAEIATLAKLTTSNDSLSEKQEEVLKKHLIPSFYAYWEGFVKDICTIYLRHINELQLKFDKIHPSLLVLAFDFNIMGEYGKYLDFNKKRENIEMLYRKLLIDMNQSVVLPTQISTESNLNYKVLKGICEKLHVSTLDIKYESSLNKLLKFRNSAAHGEFRIPVEKLPINEMRELVINLMNDLTIKIIEAYESKCYLSNNP